jgi:hypothetical protein
MDKTLILLTVAIVTLTLTACGVVDRGTASLTGYSEHCIDNVEYIQFLNGATVKYNPDGSIATC